MAEPGTPTWAQGWHPVTESRRTHVAEHPVAGLAAWLDADAGSAATGRPLPPLWHWAALSQWPTSASLGSDGHPVTGDFLPATPYPRRMWVGCSIDVSRAPSIGEAVDVERVVEQLTQKSGRGGPFALVTVRTTVTSLPGELLLTERTQLAYRGDSAATAPAETDAPDRAGPLCAGTWLRRVAPWTWELEPSPPTLMMFSALTANAHRIHYDVPYVREVEGYPSLLVHGPLMALALAEVVRREQPDRVATAITCRALRPLYLGSTAEIRPAAPTGDDQLQVELATDTVHMTAAVTFR